LIDSQQQVYPNVRNIIYGKVRTTELFRPSRIQALKYECKFFEE
jgi:hypothetical protein